MPFRLEYPLVSGRLLVNGNDFYLGNSSSQKVQIARVDQIPSVTQYVHPTTKQCTWNPTGSWTLLRDQTYRRSSFNFKYEYFASDAINLTGYCGAVCRISGTCQITESPHLYTGRILVMGIGTFLYINANETGSFNIDATNARFFETAFCKTESFSGLSFEPGFNNLSRVEDTYPVASSYGGIYLYTGNTGTSMTIAYNLRQQVWGLKII